MNLIEGLQTSNTTPVKKHETPKVHPQPKVEYKPDILDIFSEKVVNKKDLTDMVTVPRTIFKGYLCFTAGTAINAISSLCAKGNFSKGLGIVGNLISIYGTFNFVKPFLIKEKDLTNSEK